MTTTDSLLTQDLTESYEARWSKALTLEVKEAAVLVNKVTEIPWQMILGRRRFEDVANARMVLWCIMRNRGYSYSRIGKVTGRDHAAIMHANKVIPERYGAREWRDLTRWVDELEKHPNVEVIVKRKGAKK